MEGRFLAFIHKGNPGTATFDNCATRSFEQGLDSSPFNIDGDRIGENSGQGFSMIAVHSYYDIIFCHHVKLKIIKDIKMRNSTEILASSYIQGVRKWFSSVIHQNFLSQY